MSKETAYCKVIADTNNHITDWVCRGLNIGNQWLGEHLTIGFLYQGRLIGGLIYHDIRPHRDLWWTLYTTDKRWCSKRILKFMFSVAFEYFGCRRISMQTFQSNHKCLRLAKQLGFQQEGLLQQFGDQGQDVIIMGLLKNNSRY